MSYFDDQEDAWFANDCKGSPDQYDPYSYGTGFRLAMGQPSGNGNARTRKRKEQRRRAQARKKAAAKERVLAGKEG